MRDPVRRRFVGMLLFAGIGLGMAPSAFAGTVAIVNGTRTAMLSLQIRTADFPWRGNLLRDGPLGVQKQTRIFVPRDACICDLKATFEDGHRVRHPRVNLCATREYIFSDF